VAQWAPDAITAACGCVISAVLVMAAMLFDGWPAALLQASAAEQAILPHHSGGTHANPLPEVGHGSRAPE
jgi:hypothetical protein